MDINNINVKENFDILSMTTFKVGGLVKKVYFPENQKECVALLQNVKSPVILGSCSNVIFSSQGFDGIVISTIKMNNMFIRGLKMVLECGVKGPMASQTAHQNGLSGFEFMIGFPGSIGGNVFMNDRAHGQNISDTFVQACVYD